MIADLATWLREQISETRRIAEATRDQASDSGRWEVVADDTVRVVSAGRVFVRAYDVPEKDAEHIALNDPYAVLTQCEAHTAILDLHVRSRETPLPEGYPMQFMCKTCGSGEPHEYPVRWPCDTVRAVGLAYQHRPGYREEWKP